MPDDPIPTPVDLTCAKRGCGGEIAVSDTGEIHDGEMGRCDTCGRIYFATAFEDGTMRMLYDEAETRKERRAMKKEGTRAR